MATRAITRKICRNVIGIRGALKIILMAREAILGCACEAAINVAARAIHGAMRTEQWKRGAAVIEARRLPGIVAVADFAVF